MRINVDMNQLIQNASFIQGQAEEYAEVYGSVYQLLQQNGGLLERERLSCLSASS